MKATGIAVATLAAWLGLATAEAIAAPCAGFVDVDDANAEYCAAVNFMRNTGITAGCDATHYCPNDATTRLQMALFLKRMADRAVFKQGGNAFGAPAVIGTTDAQGLTVLVGNRPLLRGARVDANDNHAPTLVGGYAGNGVAAGAFGAVIAGGGQGDSVCGPLGNASCVNEVDGQVGAVGGGMGNLAAGLAATVAGGASNTAGAYGAVGGGAINSANGAYSAVGGGASNDASGAYAGVGAGTLNAASGNDAFVGGGYGNVANAESSSVGGGYYNTAGKSYATVGGGYGNEATGYAATVIGGSVNTAGGDYSVAMGYNAYVTGDADGSFVFADGSSGAFTSATANEFAVAASGGIRLRTAKSGATGCSIAAGGGSWACSSSRSVKRDFADVDPQSVLDKVAALPVQRWRYVDEDHAVRHLGTFAEDFYAAFGLGADARSITMADADGVALAAIQALYARERETAQALRDQNAELRAGLAALLARVARIEAAQAR